MSSRIKHLSVEIASTIDNISSMQALAARAKNAAQYTIKADSGGQFTVSDENGRSVVIYNEALNDLIEAEIRTQLEVDGDYLQTLADDLKHESVKLSS